MEFLPIQSFTTECVFCRRISDRQRKGMKSRHERAALFGFFRNCSETLISSDVNREGYAYRAIESAKIDGAGEYTIFFKMVLPIVQTGLFLHWVFLPQSEHGTIIPRRCIIQSLQIFRHCRIICSRLPSKCFCSISWGDHECRRIECPDNHVKFCGKLQNH